MEAILLVIGLFLAWRVLFRNPSWTAHRLLPQDARISVLIPARNEGHQIARLLRSLAEQTLKPHEIIVVDDDSSDNTSAVAGEEGATVIAGEPLPEGWNGKAWACWQGACSSSGDVLLFLDADTWLEKGGIERLVGLYEGTGLLTVQPYHVTEKSYEQLSAFFNIVTLVSVGAFTPLGQRIKPGGAFGPCVMCNRKEYFETGGHREARKEPLEDIPLAKLFLRHDLPVRCYAGHGIISFRMYARGLKELVEGWSKGVGYGALSVNPAFSIMTAAWITGCFGAFSKLIRATNLALTSSAWPTLAAALAMYCAYALLIGRILRAVGRFKWWTFVFFPLPLCFFGALVARSLFLTYVRARVVWKGRTIKTIPHE